MFPIMETERLVLRSWRDDDLAPLVAMNLSSEVMRYFPNALTPADSIVMLRRMEERIAVDGYSFAPVEEKATGEFIGFVGLNNPLKEPPLPFEPCVEIGWRLVRSAWGKGYASEAAERWLGFGFETLGLKEIVAFTAVINEPSQRVMERIGMQRDPEGDFQHANLPAGHVLCPHVLYRIDRDRYRQGLAG